MCMSLCLYTHGPLSTWRPEVSFSVTLHLGWQASEPLASGAYHHAQLLPVSWGSEPRSSYLQNRHWAIYPESNILFLFLSRESQIPSVSDHDLKDMIFLPLPPKWCQNCVPTTSTAFVFILYQESRAPCILPAEPHLQLVFWCFQNVQLWRCSPIWTV